MGRLSQPERPQKLAFIHHTSGENPKSTPTAQIYIYIGDQTVQFSHIKQKRGS